MDFKIIDGVLEEYLGEEQIVFVPEGVSVIGEQAFERNSKIKRVHLPEGVIHIAYGAFESCRNLEEINFPTTLKSIGTFAFAWCNKLTTVVVPEGVTFTKDTFASCDNLDITLTLTKLGECKNLKDLLGTFFERYLPPKTIRLNLGGDVLGGECAPNAGYLEYPVREVHILEGVKSISYRSFDGCKALSEVTLPSTLEYIGSCAFRGCSLKSLNIPTSVKKIDTSAFDSGSIRNLYVENERTWCNIDFDWETSNPLSVASLIYINGESATTFTVPEGVTEIKPYTFAGSKAIESVVIPNSVTKIGKYAFYGVKYMENVVIPDSVKDIEDSAFEGCSSLEKVTLPKGVKLGNNVFKDTSVNLETEADYEDTALVRCPDFAQTFVVKAGAKRIRKGAFKDCVIEALVLPTSIKVIEEDAFVGCKKLSRVIIAENPQEVDINNYSQKGLYIYDLENYLNIEFGTLNSSPLYLLKNLYLNDELLDDLVITCCQSVNDYSFAGAENVRTVTMEEGVTKVGYLSFVGCRGIRKFVLPSTLIDIQFSSFYTLCYHDIKVVAKGAHAKTLKMLIENGTENPTRLLACTTCPYAPLCKFLKLNHYQCESKCAWVKNENESRVFIFRESHSGICEYAETDSGQDTYLETTHYYKLLLPNSLPESEINMYVLEHLSNGATQSTDRYL